MPTTNGNKKILDLKRWEFCCIAPVASIAGSFVASSRHHRQQQLYMNSTTAAWLYNPNEDGFVQLPSPALAGTFAAGAAGVGHCWSTGSTVGAASLTATAGTTTTITTNQTLVRDLRGYSVHILSGPNAGETKTIASNTIGANSVITFTAASGSAFSASTVYRLLTPRWYVVGSGTLASGSFKTYDFATNTWTSLSNTGLPATIGTDSRLVSTPSWIDSTYKQFLTGTASSATVSSITHTGKSWTTNQWRNYQIRIVSGTGAGQIRTITTTTSDTINVGTNFTITPDNTSVYSIEGNDDFIYYMGNNAVTLYRYSISGNLWTTMTPSTARANVPNAGMSGHWIYGVTDSAWTNETSIINGRRIYSFRGSNGPNLDYYDIPDNTWVNDVTYSPKTESFTTGTKWAYNGDYLYLTKDATGRFFRYSLATNEMDGWGQLLYTQGTAIVGDTMFDVTYTDGATSIVYVYFLINTGQALVRQMVI